MKCENCGFISSKKFYRCPYCGHIHEDDRNILDKSVSFSSNFSMRLRTILYIVLFNLLGLSLLVDWYLSFKYGITLFGYILFMGIYVFLTIFSKKSSPSSIIVRVDMYILIGLLVAWCYFNVAVYKDILALVPTIIIPSFILVDTFASVMVLIFGRGKKRIRPIWFEFNLLFHLAVITVIFVFFLICKYNLDKPDLPFYFMAFGSTPGNLTPLFIFEEILIFFSFGMSLLYLINYNIILVWNIFHKVTGYYGKPRD